MASNPVISASSVGRSGQKVSTGRRDPFFFSMSIVLLLTVLVGFLPTLYLRAFRDLPPLPGHLHVHGAILTGWFVWLIVQTSLIRTNRVAHHRRLGALGAILGLAVVLRGAARHVQPRSPDPRRRFGLGYGHQRFGGQRFRIGYVDCAFPLGTVVWPNIASVATFAVLLLAALLLRRRPDTHKRLMLLASISIVGPALARISRLPGLGGEQGLFIPLALVLLLLAVVLHDLISTKRVHGATLLGGTFAVLMTIGGLAIGASQLGETFVREM